MGYITNGASFNTLREANKARLQEAVKNKHHKFHKSTKWTESQWLKAVVGELGEYANLSKKYDRGDMSETEFKKEADKELADVLIYLDILAMKIGIDLGIAAKYKFNEVSERVNSNIEIGDDDDWHYRMEPKEYDKIKPKALKTKKLRKGFAQVK